MAEAVAAAPEAEGAEAGEKEAPPPYSSTDPNAPTSTTNPTTTISNTGASNAPIAGADVTDTVLGDRESNKETEEKIQNEDAMQQASFANDTAQANAKFEHTSALSQQRTSEIGGLMGEHFAALAHMSDQYFSAETAALAAAGLPSYLAFIPGAMAYEPRTTQMTNAGWGYTSMLPGNPASSPWEPNPFGWGNIN